MNISFLIDSKEKELIEEDCLNGAVADENIKSVIKEALLLFEWIESV